MNCPRCRSGHNDVIDSRMVKQGTSIRRRRRCESCTYTWKTYERYEQDKVFEPLITPEWTDGTWVPEEEVWQLQIKK